MVKFLVKCFSSLTKISMSKNKRENGKCNIKILKYQWKLSMKTISENNKSRELKKVKPVFGVTVDIATEIAEETKI